MQTDGAKFFDHLELGKRRVGETQADRLRWLIGFTKTDLDALHPEERVALGYDLRSLVYGAGAGNRQMSWLLPKTAMSEPVLRDVHEKISTGFNRLITAKANETRPWLFPLPDSIGLTAYTDSKSKRLRFIVGTDIRSDETAVILHGVLDLLLNSGGVLRKCSECEGPFVPVRRQEYCSARCSQRARDSRRAIKGEKRKNRRTKRK
jgi:hypothetical protein